jgi:hypothetical protein
MNGARGRPDDLPARAPDDGHDHEWRKIRDGDPMTCKLPTYKCALCLIVWPTRA